MVQSAASDINLLGAIDMGAFIKSQQMKSRIFALVHDSILAEVPEGEVDFYCKQLQHFVQMDRGIIFRELLSDATFEIGEDYSMGKFAKMYGDSV